MLSTTRTTTHALFCLSLLLPVLADRKFTIINNCANTIWPALLTQGGISPTTIPGPNQGWEAQPRTSVQVSVPDTWQGRAWARQQCATTNGKFSCATGDCGSLNCTTVGEPSATLLEWGFSSIGDFYDISVVDAFNLPVEMKSNTACPTISCPANFTATCPKELQGAKAPDGTVLSCLSSCQAKTGDANQQKSNCGLSSGGTIEYYNWFHSGCPKAYASPFDDQSGAQSGLGCPGVTHADYTVTFCPEDVVNIAAPSGPFANATTSSGPASSSASGSITQTSGLSTSSQSSGTASSSSTSSTGTASSAPDSTNSADPGVLLSNKSALHSGAIAGLVIGILLGVGLSLLALWLLRRRRNRRQPTAAVDEDFTSYGADASAPTAQMIQGTEYSATLVSPTGAPAPPRPLPPPPSPALTGKRALMLGMGTGTGGGAEPGSNSKSIRTGTSSGPSAASDSLRSPTDGARSPHPQTQTQTQTDDAFEERFQARLQEFLHQHMDPPPVDGRSEAGLPAYPG